MYTSTARATGVAIASSTVLSVTCPAASTVPLPGGSPGPSSQMTMGSMITLAITHSTTTFRQCRVWSIMFRPLQGRSYDLDVAVHVPDGLHGAAEPVDVSGRA